jgi:hypothetical protein
MGMFGNLMNKIFHHAGVAERPTDAWTPERANVGLAPAATSGSGTATATPSAIQEVDLTASLDKLASSAGEKLDWRKSIVDLMKLVGIDSSISSRKELAKELNYSGSTDDSAAMNIWLHKEVMKRLAANGGKVPGELL